MTASSAPIPLRSLAVEAGSFRDPSGGVVESSGRILRYLIGDAGAAVATLLEQPWYRGLVESGDVVASSLLARNEAPQVYALDPRISVVLEHERIPVLSYAYEWPFEMLQAAALLQLRLTRAAFENGYIVKDATSFNIQFRGTRPVFIDVPSFEPYQSGEGWRAYAQFCRMFLNPLYLSAYAGIPFQPWLRSSIDGIDTDLVRSALPFRAKLRWSVFADVVLQSFLNHRFAGKEIDVEKVQARAIPDAVVRGMLDRAERTIARLRARRPRSAWVDYAQTKAHYAPEADAFKETFVRDTLAQAAPASVWDLGCNTGEYSLIAAEHAKRVVAIDADEASVGSLYRRIADAGPSNILPLAIDLTNPSPDQGWAQAERRGLANRGRADWALCLALVHHLAIGANVPLPRFAAWLASLTDAAIVEFVPKDDPMVKRLLLTRRDVYPDYTQEGFEAAMTSAFTLRGRAQIPGSKRVLYTLSKR